VITRARAAFAFVFITVLLDMLAFGLAVPVLPKLVVRLSGGDAATGAAVFGLFGTVFAAMQLLCSPIVGALSDRFGRRRVILLSNLGLGLDYILMALAPTIGWLFVGRVIAGITSSSFATAGAYIADVTPAERRAARFGMLGVAFGIGFIVGPAVGGLLGDVDLRAPFWAAAALSFANFAYRLFILPESLPPERRAPFRWHAANPIGALQFLRSRRGLAMLGTAGFFAYVAHDALPTMFVLYTDYRYGWDARAVGLALALVGVSSMIVQGLVVGRVVRALGEARALATGLLVGTMGLAIFALAPTSPLFVVGIPVWAFFGLTSPSLQGLMSRLVGSYEQGRLQGALASVHAIGSLAAPVLFTQTFAAAVGALAELRLPGAPFLLGSALLLTALAFASRSRGPAQVAAGSAA